jgi:hypothetical protein
MEFYENGGGAVAKLSWQVADSSTFESGWENGQVHGFADKVLYSRDVAGYFNSSSPPPECSRRYRETVRSGDYSLMISGYSRASYAYCYYQVFDLNIPVVNGMKIGYWIYHAAGTPKISVDGHFTDGTNGWTLRDFKNNGYLTDQYGVRIHPAARKDPMNQWYYVEVDLSKAAGKTIDFIMFGFDNGNDGFKGQYRAYVDDFKIFSSSASSPPEGKSKLSIHTGFLGGESMLFIEQAKPTVVKILDNFGPASQVKQKSPDTKIVGRIYDDANQRMDGSPEDRAQEWWNRHGNRINSYPAVDYWEGYNEPGNLNATEMAWYARFEKRRVEILAQNGKKACIGNFSTGTPDVNNPEIWPAFYLAIDAARANNGVLGLHEYSAPNMQNYYSGDAATGEGWLTGRYRKVYRQYLTPAGREIPLVITECGIDGGVGGGGAGGGWKNYQSPENYFNQLKWYDSLLEEDGYVLGATIFCLEIYGWDDFDIRGTVRELLTEYVQ